jgi:hypothetical protein
MTCAVDVESLHSLNTSYGGRAVSKVRAEKACKSVEVESHTLLTAELDECEWTASRSSRFTLGTG